MALSSFAKVQNPFLKRTQPGVGAPTVPGQDEDLSSLLQSKTAPAPNVPTAPGPAAPANPYLRASQPTQMTRAPMPATGMSSEPPAPPAPPVPQPTQMTRAPMPAMGVSSAPPAPSMVRAPMPAPQMETQMAGAAAQNAGAAAGTIPNPAANVTDLNALIGGNLEKIMTGNNPAMEQAQRSAMNGLGAMQKSGQAAAIRKAQSLGFAPGTPEFERVMSEAETANTSAGSGALSDLAQKGFDQQNAALNMAGNFALGQQNFGLNTMKRGDQVDQFGQSLANNKDQFGQTLANDKDQFGQTIANRRDEFGATLSNTKDEFGQTMANRKDEFGQTMGSSNKQNELAALDKIISDPTSSIAQVQAAKAQRGQLSGFNTADPSWNAKDPNNAQMDLDTIKQGLVARYPELASDPAKLDQMARERYGKADDAYWNSLGMGSAIDAPPVPGGVPAPGGGGTDGFFTGMAQPMNNTGKYATDDSIAALGRGAGNIAEGNILTGTGQILGGVGSAGVNLGRDFITGAGDVTSTMEDGLNAVGSGAKKLVRKWNPFG